MRTESFPAAGRDGKLLIAEPLGDARAVILLLHGMAEHIRRYRWLAETLAASGYAAGGYDQAGHGPDTSRDDLGHFAPFGGWQALLDDASGAAMALRGLFPGRPLVMLGHSMGSFIAREYAIRQGRELDGLVLSGTGWWPKPVCGFGRLAAGTAGLFGREAKPSALMNWAVFTRNNRPFQPARTPFDWLSRDEEEVAAYAADPLCGFPFTSASYRCFFDGLLKLADLGRLRSIPASLPVYLFSGEKDPVGASGRGVREVARQYRDAGLESVTLRLYPGARHEMPHELNRSEVAQDLIHWLDNTVAGR